MVNAYSFVVSDSGTQTLGVNVGVDQHTRVAVSCGTCALPHVARSRTSRSPSVHARRTVGPQVRIPTRCAEFIFEYSRFNGPLAQDFPRPPQSSRFQRLMSRDQGHSAYVRAAKLSELPTAAVCSWARPLATTQLRWSTTDVRPRWCWTQQTRCLKTRRLSDPRPDFERSAQSRREPRSFKLLEPT